MVAALQCIDGCRVASRGRLWVAHEDDGNPDRLERRIDELSIALAEFVDLVAGGEM